MFFPSRSWTLTQVIGVKPKTFMKELSRRNSSARSSDYEGELCRRYNSDATRNPSWIFHQTQEPTSKTEGRTEDRQRHGLGGHFDSLHPEREDGGGGGYSRLLCRDPVPQQQETSVPHSRRSLQVGSSQSALQPTDRCLLTLTLTPLLNKVLPPENSSVLTRHLVHKHRNCHQIGNVVKTIFQYFKVVKIK